MSASTPEVMVYCLSRGMFGHKQRYLKYEDLTRFQGRRVNIKLQTGKTVRNVALRAVEKINWCNWYVLVEEDGEVLPFARTDIKSVEAV